MAFIGGLLWVVCTTHSFGIVATDSLQYWELTDEGIIWRIKSGEKLPHQDNIEMSGKRISAIIDYRVEKDGSFTLKKDLIFPQLRTYNKTNEPAWRRYRAYFRRQINSELAPVLSSEGQIIKTHLVDSVLLDGMMTIYYQPVNSL
ncbi:MAG: hypothetical protein AAFO69_03135, partial [Bacteroidota bacterium]